MDVYSPCHLEKFRPLVAVVLGDLNSHVLVHSIEATVQATANYGTSLRFAQFPLQHRFPKKKAGSWMESDGSGVKLTHLPNGILKKGWIQKHLSYIPSVVLYIAKLDLSLSPNAWATVEKNLISDVTRFNNELSPRDTRLLLVVLIKGTTTALGRDSSEISEQRLIALRRFGIDSQLVHPLSDTDLNVGSDALRRLTMQVKELSFAHYNSVINRLRRHEKMLHPNQPLANYLPILARTYFKIGCVHEALGNDEKSFAAFNDSLRVLGSMMSFCRKGSSSYQLTDGNQHEPSATHSDAQNAVNISKFSWYGDCIGQIRGVAELLHLRLALHHFNISMNKESAISHFKKYMSMFEIPIAAAQDSSVPLAACMRYGWLSQQHHAFADLLKEHVHRYPMMSDSSVGSVDEVQHHLLVASLHAVRRRKAARSLPQLAPDQLIVTFKESSWVGGGFEVPGLPDMVEKVHLDFETRVPHAEISVSLFKKLLGSSLALDPSGIYIRDFVFLEGRIRQQCSFACMLGDELEACGQIEESLTMFSKVIDVLQESAWHELSVSVLIRMITCIEVAMKKEPCSIDQLTSYALDAALRLGGNALRPYVSIKVAKESIQLALQLANILCSKLKDNERQYPLPSHLSLAKDNKLRTSLEKHHDILMCSGGFDEVSAAAGDAVTLHLYIKNLTILDFIVGEIEVHFSSPLMGCVVTSEIDSNSKIDTARSLASKIICKPIKTDRLRRNLAQQLFAPSLSISAGELLHLELHVNVPCSVSSTSELLGIQNITMTCTKIGSSDSGIVFTVRPSALTDLHSKCPGSAVSAVQRSYMHILPPAPKVSLAVSNPIEPLLVGALSPIVLEIAGNGDIVEGGTVRFFCAPVPKTDRIEDAFFWGKIVSSSEQRKDSSFLPLPLRKNMQPLECIHVQSSMRTSGDKNKFQVILWVRPSSIEPVAVTFNLEYHSATTASSSHLNASEESIIHQCEIIHVIHAQIPFMSSIRFIGAQDLQSVEPDDKSSLVLINTPVSASLDLTALTEASLNVHSIEVVLSSEAQFNPRMIGSSVLYESKTNAGDAVVLTKDDVYSLFFKFILQCEGAGRLGHLRICWSRSYSVPEQYSSVRNEFFVSELSLPELEAKSSYVLVHQNIPSRIAVGEIFQVQWTLENKTLQYEEVAVQVWDAETFFRTSSINGAILLQPGEIRDLIDILVPLKCGHAKLPQVSFSSKNGISVFLNDVHNSIYVVP